ncbi:MAG TPA: DUF885 domain-containing protein [Candidatus Acidoferrum sp.]|nr:DUF885 domain-containing protein [Candidatus Acidoferrum sp.]
MRNHVFAFALLIACALVNTAMAVEPATSDAELQKFFRRYLDERFVMHPVEATALGDHRFDERLDDLSPEALKRSLELLKTTRVKLRKEIDRTKLSRDGQIDFEIFDHELRTAIWLRENTNPFSENPRLYNEYISDSVFLLLTQSRLPKETNVANAIARMKQIPRIISAARQNLKRPPKAVLETAILQNKGSIGFYEKDIFEFVGESPQLPALKAEAARAVPIIKEYQQFLEKELMPKATDEWRIGKRKFSKKLELVLNADMSASDVLRDAKTEFKRVHAEMYVVARQLWSRYFAREPLPQDDAEGKHATIARVLGAVAKEHGKPEELVNDARTTVARIKEFIRERDIMRLPEPDRCQIIEMPEFQRGNSVAYMNGAPPLDPDAPTMYAISPPAKDWDAKRVQSLLEEYNRHMLQILTIHEAYPGHYVQLDYGARVPSLIRRVMGSGVYVEGWAVYTEQMMLDQGYGERDLALRLTQLKFYLRAVCNAILDHKLHCANMSDDEAMKLMVEGAFQSEQEARLKLVRAKQSSVQLSTYFTGRMAMVRLREGVQRTLGDGFQLGRYHEAVLSQGAVPVKYLPELVRGKLGVER